MLDCWSNLIFTIKFIPVHSLDKSKLSSQKNKLADHRQPGLQKASNKKNSDSFGGDLSDFKCSLNLAAPRIPRKDEYNR